MRKKPLGIEASIYSRIENAVAPDLAGKIDLLYVRRLLAFRPWNQLPPKPGAELGREQLAIDDIPHGA